LAELAAAIVESKLDAVVVGNTASVLHGAPVMTQDVDLLVRDTKPNRTKLVRLAATLGGAKPQRVSELASALRIHGTQVPVDILFDALPGRLSFASVKSRAVVMPAGRNTLTVASLADVIQSKEAAGRDKDKAVLPILRATLATLEQLELIK
jgi:hypothetical protein